MTQDATGDIKLLRLIQVRQQEALDALYRTHATAVFSLSLRICRDAALAEEATQDTFLQIWRDADRYEPDRGSVRSWILMMARARALDRLRAQRARTANAVALEPSIDAIADRGGGPEYGAAASETVAEIDSVLDFLPADDRRLIDLAYTKGLTHSEIAAALNRPVGTVKTQMRRVLCLLRSALVATRRPFAWCPWPESARARLAADASLQELHVLVVDDDADTLRLIAFVLRRAGAQVMAAASADQAMRMMTAVWPDVLVSDLEMPVEDGFSLLERVRALAARHRRHVPAIAFSAHTGARDRMRVAAAGFSHHLAKPIRPSHLIERIAAAASRLDSDAPIIAPGATASRFAAPA